jgi:hypothetical protein
MDAPLRCPPVRPPHVCKTCQTLELTCWPTGVAAPFASDVTFFHVCAGLVVERAGVSACAVVTTMQATRATCLHHAIVPYARQCQKMWKKGTNYLSMHGWRRMHGTLHRCHRRRSGGVKRSYQARNASPWLTSESGFSPRRPAQHL